MRLPVPPDSTDDGEQDIPFDLSLEAVGSQGTGVDSNLSIAQTALGDPSSPVNILAVTGEQSSPTSLALEVNVALDSTVEDQMSMAGSYADTLTFTYTDLWTQAGTKPIKITPNRCYFKK